jgi:hypothetical protein
MARQRGGGRRGVGGPIADILGRITEFFRLGRFFGRSAGTPEAPSRPRLRTVEEIVAEAQAMRAAAPSAPVERWRWSYVCVWYDRATGDRVGEWRWNVETNSGTNYQQASAQARRLSSTNMPPCIAREVSRGRDFVLRCRRVGGPLQF